MTKVFKDAQTEQHFCNWLSATVPQEEQFKTYWEVYELLRQDPGYQENRSWSEIRNIAEHHSTVRSEILSQMFRNGTL